MIQTNMNILTEQWLINNDFVLLEDINDDEYNLHYKSYEKYIQSNISVNVTIRLNMSNTIGRDYSVHIDNADFCSIFNADIQTIEHLNKAMEFIDCDYRF